MSKVIKIVIILAFMVIGFVLAKIAFDYIVVPLNIELNSLLTVGLYEGFILAFAFFGMTVIKFEE